MDDAQTPVDEAAGDQENTGVAEEQTTEAAPAVEAPEQSEGGQDEASEAPAEESAEGDESAEGETVQA